MTIPDCSPARFGTIPPASPRTPLSDSPHHHVDKKIRAEFHMKTPLGSNSKFQYSFHGLRVLRPTLDTGFAPPSTFFPNPSPQSFSSAPRRDPLSSGPHFRSLPAPIHPSSYLSFFVTPVAHSPSQPLSRGPQSPDLNTHRTLRRHSAPTPCEYSAPTPSGVHR